MMRYGIDDIRHLQGGDLLIPGAVLTVKFSYNWIREWSRAWMRPPGPWNGSSP
jgi:hypothetical protein